MHKNLISACLLVCFLCQSGIAQEAADLVLHNGKIVVVDKDFSVVQAMAIRKGRVAFTGSDVEVQHQMGSGTKKIDLKGRMVLPGLLDSHVHATGASQFEADHEIPSMNSIDDVLDYVRSRARVVPQGEWITISQVFITRLREQRFPNRNELDQAAPNHPVFFRTGPDGSANSLALEINGIAKAFAATHPDNVMVDPENKEPNGIIRNASAVIKKSGNSSAKKLSEAESDNLLVKLLRDYNRSGLTGVIDRNCGDSAQAQYERLLHSGTLSVRVRLSRGLSPSGNLSDIEKKLDEFAADPFFRAPNPRLGIIGIKCFQDGGMLTGSAYFLRPWGVSQIYGISDPAYRGMQYIDVARMEEMVRLCAERNLAFTAHCQGDAAVEALASVYAKVNRDIPIRPTRSTITHSSFMNANAIDLAEQVGFGIDLQPAWLYLDARTLVMHFGEERLKYFIPLRTLLEKGIVAGGGSDHMQKIGSLRSVNPYNPFLGMWVAATRKARWHEKPVRPEQALSREQMIRFYTINNAWLMRMENEIGSLEKGKRADFVVIDRDLLNCPLDEIKETIVHSTWLDGESVYEARAERSE